VVAGLFAATAVAWAVAAVANVLAWRDGAPGAFPPAFPAFLALAILSPASVGLFVAVRRPGNRVAWILLAGPLTVAVVMAGDGLSRLWLGADPSSTAGAWAALVSCLWPVLFAWPIALAFRFPDGRLPSRRWRIPWWLAVASFGGALLLITPVDPIERGDGLDVANPLPATLPRGIGEPMFWVCWGGIVASLVLRRSRCGSGTGPAGRGSGARCCGWPTAPSCCRCGWAAGRSSGRSGRGRRRSTAWAWPSSRCGRPWR
jgi:hypothetical protein